ncbi:hypothetical protein J6590_009432 [Homalodisca vitripennis]|nr:hypothetical protein J6590_009432 [Homalodisca vitripennis]
MWGVLLALLEVAVVRPVKTLSLMTSQRRSSCSGADIYEEHRRRRGCLWGLLGDRRAASTDMELLTVRHGGRYEYTALEADSTAHERMELERKAREQAQSACLHYLRCCPRYSLLQHLNDIGSRVDKHWFIVRDSSIKTERLLTLVPKSLNCPIKCDAETRQVILDLFLALQHPYIYPILDLEFREGAQVSQTFIVLVLPFNTKGSLKDLIYKAGVTSTLALRASDPDL